AVGRFPLPTTGEWGEGTGEGIPISRANSVEGAPLPSPPPLVPRRESEREASTMVVLSRGAPGPPAMPKEQQKETKATENRSQESKPQPLIKTVALPSVKNSVVRSD